MPARKDRPRNFHAPAYAAAGVLAFVLLIAAPAWGATGIAPATFLSSTPPFHGVKVSDHNATTGSGVVARSMVISVKGTYSAAQNATTHGNSSAIETTHGTFFSTPFSMPATTSSLAVNASGSATGSATLTLGCTNNTGRAIAKFNITFEIRVFDVTTGKWIGSRTHDLYNHALGTPIYKLTCPWPTTIKAVRNLSTSWTVSLTPSLTGVTLTDKFEVASILLLKTQVTSTVGGWCESLGQIKASLLFMDITYR